MDLPRNSTELAERHSQLSNAIVDASTEATHEGRLLLERVSSIDPGADGVRRKVSIFHTASFFVPFPFGFGLWVDVFLLFFGVPFPFGFCLWGMCCCFLGPTSLWVLFVGGFFFWGGGVPFPFGIVCGWMCCCFLGSHFPLGFVFGWMCFWGSHFFWGFVLGGCVFWGNGELFWNCCAISFWIYSVFYWV